LRGVRFRLTIGSTRRVVSALFRSPTQAAALSDRSGETALKQRGVTVTGEL
jgi:hypothetical protein